MPTYVYRREDGATFEKNQRITDEPLDECPETGQSVERIITGSPGIIDATTDGSRERAQSKSGFCCGPRCGL